MMYVLIKFLIMFKGKHINQSGKIYDDHKINLMFKNRDESKYNIIIYFVVIPGHNIILKDQIMSEIWTNFSILFLNW